MSPFLKWAGGKRWLFDDAFVSSLPKYDRYIEPFLGGGAGFFAVSPEIAILADVNEELINLYRQVRDGAQKIERALSWLQSRHSKDLYYRIRALQAKSDLSRAIRTLYLNRSCWNGLYRLNKAGSFNVPIGTKDRIEVPVGSLSAAAKRLQNAKIICSDFEAVIDIAVEGDLIFVDPPYTVKHNFNGFVKYNESIFSWNDQLRLKDCLIRAKRRGAFVVMTNADHESLRELYAEARMSAQVGRASIISGNRTGRTRTTELLVLL